jgi:predicted GNAT superfamily acetyltransferase
VAPRGDRQAIRLRDVDDVAGMRAVEALEREVWGLEDRDVTPLTMLVATKAVGAVLVGAYDGEALVGFVYGFAGVEDGRLVHHSHMLAVKPAYRDLDLGFELKLAQRERVLAQGVARITWTFDPLQGRNAHFNFAKLGVVADAYKVNFYGEETSSFLHKVGTDRLWVTWLLDSPRVRSRVEGAARAPFDLEGARPLVRVGAGGEPELDERPDALGREHAFVEIPDDINAVQRADFELAVRWREATRPAFAGAIGAGYVVDDFRRVPRAGGFVGVYRLRRGVGPDR